MNNGLYGVITGPPPVNDHTCTRCGNKKCSKTEKSCWSCGEAIPKEDHIDTRNLALVVIMDYDRILKHA